MHQFFTIHFVHRHRESLSPKVGARLRRVRRPVSWRIAEPAGLAPHAANGRHAVAPLPNTEIFKHKIGRGQLVGARLRRVRGRTDFRMIGDLARRYGRAKANGRHAVAPLPQGRPMRPYLLPPPLTSTPPSRSRASGRARGRWRHGGSSRRWHGRRNDQASRGGQWACARRVRRASQARRCRSHR
jgi:hypothetical protein